MKIIQHKIFLEIISLLIIVSLIPIAALSFLLNKVSEKSIKKSVFNGFQNLSQRTAREVNLYISSTENNLKTTAYIISKIYHDEWRSKLLLRELIQNKQGFETIILIDKQGNEIVSSEVDLKNLNYTQENYFKRAISGNTFYSQITLSNELIPIMRISIPVEKNKEIIGVLTAEITVRYLWDLVENIHIGETGYIYIIDKTGTIIAHPQRERVLKHEQFNLSSFKNSLGDEYINLNKITVLGAMATIPNLGWNVIVEQPTKEALALNREIRYTNIGLAILTIIFCISIGYIRAKKISSPVKQLTEGVRRVSQGDLSYTINISSQNEIGELAQKFNEMTINLKNTQEKLIQNERLALLGKVSSKIAHEVRNPLEAIKGSAVYLKECLVKDKKVQKFTSIIIDETNQLNSFISLVLSSARKVQLEPILTNINELIENIFYLISKDNRFKQINVIKTLDAHIPLCYLDPEHLQRAFLNVIINAMEAITLNGEIQIITEYITYPEKCIKIIFKDNGIGISEKAKENLFKPFFTTKKTGTGLGLFHFHETIMQHQGSINIESAKDKGTTIIVYLPVKTLNTVTEGSSLNGSV